jgi:nicotinamide-nucleotide amidase
MQFLSNENSFEKLGITLGKILLAKNLMLVTAESCTGGWIAEAITSVSGSSEWFERGFVTYSIAAKQEMLGVKAATLKQYGAVSEQAVQEMAEGALKHSHADVSIAVTGIAGPTGGTPEKPVGLVLFGWARKNFLTTISSQQFRGDRNVIRLLAVKFALEELINLLASN